MKRLILLFFVLLFFRQSFSQDKTWNGSVSTEWNNDANWTPAVKPSVADDVIIPSGTSNQPTLSVNTAVVKSVQVQSGATFTIANSGELTINGFKTFDLSVDIKSTAFQNSGTVENSGKLILGSLNSVGEYGLWNTATFNNNAGGEILLDRSTATGLRCESGTTFTNAGKLIIGGTASVGEYGLYNFGTFNNDSGGEITVDRSTGWGVINGYDTFTNAGNLTIDGPVGSGYTGFENQAVVQNEACGQVIINQGGLSNRFITDYINLGYTFVTGDIQNQGSITNNGVLKYGTASQNPIINNQPSSVILNDNAVPIFTYGTTSTAYTGTVNGIFKDAAATISAGSYDLASNTFIPGSTLAVGSQILYAKITENSCSETRVIPFNYNNKSVATLSALTSSIGTLSPSFDSVILNYTASDVDNAVTTLTVTPTATDPLATISVKVNGAAFVAVNSSSSSNPLTLIVGINTITIRVTAQDGTFKEYLITVTRLPNATLSSLTISDGALSPTFNSQVLTYSATVEYLTNSLTVLPVAASSNATLTVDGTAVISGDNSDPILLAVGINTINVLVTAQDGVTTKNYAITVTRLSTCTPVATATESMSWTGAKNTDWNETCNWSPIGIPTSTNDVIIPAAPSTQPTLISNAGVARSVQIESGAVLTIANSGQLTINNYKIFTASGILSSAAFQNSGTLDNSGRLILGTTNPIGDYGLWNTGFVHNYDSGEITVDRSATRGIFNAGTFSNAATLTIGGISNVGSKGIFNISIFDNTAGGNISVDRAVNNGIFNDGTFSNTAILTIGGIDMPGESGISNYATFTNNAGGQISIDRTTSAAIGNSSGTFTNAAKLTIGGIASAGNWGVFNNATFNNETGGDISIDNSALQGIYNQGVFTNAAKLVIGKTSSVGKIGIYNTGTFNNITDGEISIDRTTQMGFGQFDGIFTNAAKLVIGDLASVGYRGFYTVDVSIFNNVSCGEVLVKQGLLENRGPYNNYGYTLVEDRLSSYDTFTNEGILKYNLNSGNPINTTNSSIIVKNSPTPIFDYGDVNDNYNGVISIFSDSASMISAGTFTAPNAFVPDPILPIGSQTLYAKITPSGGLCSHIVPFTYNNKTNANLIALTSSAGTLNPVFNSAESRYTISVDDLTTSITLTPTTLASAATVTVNGNAVSSGAASTAINLNSGFNTIAILVTAEDGITIKTYTVVVTRSDNLISITPVLSYICPGESVQFTASGCTGVISWEGSDGQQATGVTSTFTPAITTMYIANCSTGGNAAFSIQVAAISVAITHDILNESIAVNALEQITSNRKIGLAGITPTVNISFEAGNFIELLPGFEAVNSSVFRAEIKQCPNL